MPHTAYQTSASCMANALFHAQGCDSDLRFHLDMVCRGSTEPMTAHCSSATQTLVATVFRYYSGASGEAGVGQTKPHRWAQQVPESIHISEQRPKGC